MKQQPGNIDNRGYGLKDTILIALVGILGSSLLKLVAFSLRWQVVGLENYKEYQDKPFIMAFWHNRLLMMAHIYLKLVKAKVPIYSLISSHRDGRFIADAVKRLGISSIAGSSSRGGARAVVEMLVVMRSGARVGLTPDGPKGPNQKAKAGVVDLARKSGQVIIPFAFGAERAIRFNSWDRMVFPKPFSRAVAVVGKAIKVPEGIEGDEFDQYLLQVEEAINSVSREADEYQYS